jgi:hypothetical protein
MYYNRLLFVRGSIKATLGDAAGYPARVRLIWQDRLLGNEGPNEKKLSTHQTPHPAAADCTPQVETYGRG